MTVAAQVVTCTFIIYIRKRFYSGRVLIEGDCSATFLHRLERGSGTCLQIDCAKSAKWYTEVVDISFRGLQL